MPILERISKVTTITPKPDLKEPITPQHHKYRDPFQTMVQIGPIINKPLFPQDKCVVQTPEMRIVTQHDLIGMKYRKP